MNPWHTGSDSGDRLRINVFGEEGLSGDFEVDGSGFIAFPLIGEIQADSNTLSELGQVIAEKLLDGYLKDPRLSAESFHHRPFYILARVKKLGSYPFVDGRPCLRPLRSVSRNWRKRSLRLPALGRRLSSGRCQPMTRSALS